MRARSRNVLDLGGAFGGACPIVEPEAIGGEETPAPADAPPLDPFVVIRGWQPVEDGPPGTLLSQVFSDPEWLALDASLVARIGMATRLHGSPRWILSAEESPRPGWRFIGQLDSTDAFLEPPSANPSWVSADPER